VDDEEQRQQQGGHSHQLEEPLPRVFRVGEAEGGINQGATAEEVPELDGDKAEKEGLQAAQDGCHLHSPQG